jgi:hypothetical protein
MPDAVYRDAESVASLQSLAPVNYYAALAPQILKEHPFFLVLAPRPPAR